MLSIINCRTMRPRPAPMASRTPISRCRADARASSRLATLAHAISSTSAATPISTKSGVAYCSRRNVHPVPPEKTGTTRPPALSAATPASAAQSPVRRFGARRSARRASASADAITRLSGARAHAARSCPGRASPAIGGSSRGSAATGTVTSAIKPTSAPTNPRGLTPAMLTGTPFRRMRLAGDVSDDERTDDPRTRS